MNNLETQKRNVLDIKIKSVAKNNISLQKW